MRQFGFQGMQERLREMLHELYVRPFGPEQEAAGKSFAGELEARRQTAMQMHIEGMQGAYQAKNSRYPEG